MKTYLIKTFSKLKPHQVLFLLMIFDHIFYKYIFLVMHIILRNFEYFYWKQGKIYFFGVEVSRRWKDLEAPFPSFFLSPSLYMSSLDPREWS